MPFSAAPDGVRIRIRLTPRASASRIQGLVAEADGSRALKIMVTAVAEGGKANAALIDLLARHWRLPKRDFAIVAGTTDRRKLVRIAGDPARLLPVLNESIAAFAGRCGPPE